MALETADKLPSRQALTLLFRSGKHAAFQAESFTVSRSVVDGSLTGIKWTGIVGAQPLWFDPSEVVLVQVEDVV